MSKIKIFISLSLFVGACYLIASIPIRWYHHAPFYMEPVDVVHVTSGEFGGKILTPEDWKEIHEDLQREQDDVLGGINWVNAEKLLGQQRFDPLAELPAPALYSRRIKPHDIVTEGEVLAIVDDPQAVRYRDDFVSRLKQWEIQGRIVMQHREAAGQVNAVVQIHEAKEQMLKLRKQLADALRSETGSDRYGFIAEHRGMFSRLGLSEEQVIKLRENHAIYMILHTVRKRFIVPKF